MTTFLTNEALHQKTPQELTALLYEACLTNLEDSLTHIDEKDFIRANEKLQKASDIVHRLGAGINYEAGIVADQLEQVYNYMADKLVEANLKKDKAVVQEVITVLEPIMNAWNEAMKTKRDIQPKTMKQKVNAYENYSVYKS
ncbi:flagellar export chaperone FliS [Halalkalibacter nanhaiisediminis]|uniref:Flagellar secretion chaperone FliS n=1 Tax=Halalkalibacter nanhaiisediminis TaxID=688079 RepID=A0A562QP89_9BACI|nr:flagellar export chaperone FliS [Halalkalibacter nanhaiisediminis]TWI57876.1 flagellar protein FliS [Halalkalibacter nanhaiisediminis]